MFVLLLSQTHTHTLFTPSSFWLDVCLLYFQETNPHFSLIKIFLLSRTSACLSSRHTPVGMFCVLFKNRCGEWRCEATETWRKFAAACFSVLISRFTYVSVLLQNYYLQLSRLSLSVEFQRRTKPDMRWADWFDLKYFAVSNKANKLTIQRTTSESSKSLRISRNIDLEILHQR